MAAPVETHPVQRSHFLPRHSARAPVCVTLRAYEVYKHCFGEQKAMIEGWCRGGFSAGEIIAFLYAYPFPRNEWCARVDEAMKGMEHL